MFRAHPTMKYKKIPAEDRERVIQAHKEEKDWKQVAKTLGINIRTAYRWLSNEQIIPKEKGGSKSKKTPEIIQVLVDSVENNPSITLAELAQILFTTFNLRVCLNTVKNWLDGQLFSLKNVRRTVYNMNSAENKLKRSYYMEHLFDARANGRTLVWMDETNFNLYCSRKEGRSRIGARATLLLPSSKGANLHCIGAMTSTRMVLFTTKRGSFNSQTCQEWFRELIETCNTQGIENPTFIVDNAPAHCRLEEVIAEYEDTQLLRLAPYSYLLNPIELVWSSFKSHVKRELRERMREILQMQRNRQQQSMQEQRMLALEEIARVAIATITPVMLTRFVNRVEQYYAAAVRQEDLADLK